MWGERREGGRKRKHIEIKTRLEIYKLNYREGDGGRTKKRKKEGERKTRE